MNLVKNIRLVLTFYKTFLLASWLITFICAEILWKYGMGTFTFLFWFKLFTLAVIFYFIKRNKSKEFFYYQNLGLSKTLLWCTSLSVDFLLFILSLIVAFKIR
jgi:hypothetical protein